MLVTGQVNFFMKKKQNGCDTKCTKTEKIRTKKVEAILKIEIIEQYEGNEIVLRCDPISSEILTKTIGNDG